MSKKLLSGIKMACPVPPWTPQNIVRLAKYLGISQARLTSLLGISYSALRAWIDGRSKSISPSILARLKKFEGKIRSFRAKAEEKFSEVSLKEERRKSRLPKPWPVSRIRSFMHTWGMSQIEFAIFAGVSYDTVTSWSRGRRRLVRRDTAEHLMSAEKVATQRGFSKKSSDSKENPWSALRKFAAAKVELKDKEIPKNCQGNFLVQVIEKTPGQFKAAKNAELVTISAGKKKKSVLEVKLNLGKQILKFEGRWIQLGGVKVIELSTDKDDKNFMNGTAGCITPSKNLLRISLWSAKDIPVRLTASKK